MERRMESKQCLHESTPLQVLGTTHRVQSSMLKCKPPFHKWGEKISVDSPAGYKPTIGSYLSSGGFPYMSSKWLRIRNIDPMLVVRSM
jgi:hypothetical protein